jgi:carbon storage regulator
MLVLSRKVGEKIHIGNDVMVEVRRISGNRVTLALRAPRDVRILRAELEPAATEFEVAIEQPVDNTDQQNESVVKSHSSINRIDSFVKPPSTAEFVSRVDH